jgi:hypothetical protein
MSDLKDQIEQLPRRIEYLGGQQFSYVKLDDVLALIEQDDEERRYSLQERLTPSGGQ